MCPAAHLNMISHAGQGNRMIAHAARAEGLSLHWLDELAVSRKAQQYPKLKNFVGIHGSQAAFQTDMWSLSDSNASLCSADDLCRLVESTRYWNGTV